MYLRAGHCQFRIGPMRKRSSRTPKEDENEAAFEAIARLTGMTVAALKGKNPAAVALGRLGGLKGGKARAEKLSKRERSRIATRAARARWGTRKPNA